MQIWGKVVRGMMLVIAAVFAVVAIVVPAARSGVETAFSSQDWSADIAGFKNTNVGKPVEQAIDQAVQFIILQLENIPWEGTIIMVKDGKIYINRGSREGITVGQSFVVGAMERVRDPIQGRFLTRRSIRSAQ